VNPIDNPKNEHNGTIFGRLAQINPDADRIIYLTDLTVQSDFNMILKISSPRQKNRFQIPIDSSVIFNKEWSRGLPGAENKSMFIETTQDSHINYCAVEV